MRGKPKFKIGDKVCFELQGETKVGVVFVVDDYGTLFDDSDASYDIMVEKENMLYKHFTEKLVKPYKP